MASERLWCSLLRPAALALLFSPLSRGFSIYKRQMKTETKMTIGFNSKQQKRRNRKETEREVVKIVKVLIRDVVRKLRNGSSLLLKIKDVKCVNFQLWLLCRVTLTRWVVFPRATPHYSLWMAMFIELKLWYEEATILLQSVCTVVCKNNGH